MTSHNHRDLILGFSTTLYLLCAGCGPASVDGKGDADSGAGAQDQSTIEGNAPAADRRSAEGSASARVVVTRIEDGTVVSEGEVAADGRYSVPTQAGLEGLIVAVVDAEGDVLGEATLGHSGEAGETVYVAPMTAETRLEAEVAVSLSARGDAPDLVDLRSRINAELAATSADADALSITIEAAQQAEASYASEAESSAQGSAEAAAQVRLEALAWVDARLHDGEMSAEEADAALASADLEAWAEAGLSSEAAARAESAGSLALRLSTRAMLSAEADGAAALRSAEIEAWATQEAMADAAVELGAEAFATASSELVSEVEGSADAEAAAAAWAGFEAEVMGSSEAALDGLLADTMGQVYAEVVATASVEAALDLELAAQAALTAATASSGMVDADALASGVVEAQIAFEQAISAASSAGAGSEAAASAAILASGGFRAHDSTAR